jgi:hypothetical protein
MGKSARPLLQSGPANEHADLQRLVDEQTALRRVATLVAAGAGDDDLIAP